MCNELKFPDLPEGQWRSQLRAQLENNVPTHEWVEKVN